MRDEGIIVVGVLCIICICVGYWLGQRRLRRMQGSITQLQATYQQTQEILLQSQQANMALSQALRSPHQQGHWGEMQLRHAVELAGMLQHCDFETQVRFGSWEVDQRPDMVILLYGGRMIFVDAKAPLESCMAAANVSDETMRRKKLDAFTQQVKVHIRALENRAYWDQAQPSPELVILYLPTESIFRMALEHDPTLLDYGTQHRVLLASPSSLIGLLKAVAYGWSQETRAHNVQQILVQSQQMQRELAALSQQWQKVGRALDATVREFNQAVRSYGLTVLPSMKQLQDLGGLLEYTEQVLRIDSYAISPIC